MDNFRHACEQYNIANNAYKTSIKNSRSLRVEFLKEVANEYSKKNNTEAEKELKVLIHVEEQRDQARRIQNALNTKSGGGVTSILIPAPSEYENEFDKSNYMDINIMWERLQISNGNDIQNWDRITDRKTMEELLLKWQERHFQQANETPLASKKMGRQING